MMCPPRCVKCLAVTTGIGGWCGGDVCLNAKHDPDCDSTEDPTWCPCCDPSGRDDPTSISNLMAEGPPR